MVVTKAYIDNLLDGMNTQTTIKCIVLTCYNVGSLKSNKFFLRAYTMQELESLGIYLDESALVSSLNRYFLKTEGIVITEVANLNDIKYTIDVIKKRMRSISNEKKVLEELLDTAIFPLEFSDINATYFKLKEDLKILDYRLLKKHIFDWFTINRTLNGVSITGTLAEKEFSTLIENDIYEDREVLRNHLIDFLAKSWVDLMTSYSFCIMYLDELEDIRKTYPEYFV